MAQSNLMMLAEVACSIRSGIRPISSEIATLSWSFGAGVLRPLPDAGEKRARLPLPAKKSNLAHPPQKEARETPAEVKTAIRPVLQDSRVINQAAATPSTRGNGGEIRTTKTQAEIDDEIAQIELTRLEAPQENSQVSEGKCKVCGHKYKADYHELHRHYLTHLIDKPFKCFTKGCTYAGAQNANLLGHCKRRKHKYVSGQKWKSTLPASMRSL